MTRRSQQGRDRSSPAGGEGSPRDGSFLDVVPVRLGAIGGIVAYAVWYVLVYALERPGRLGEAAPWQVNGWEFYRLQFVELTVEAEGLSMAAINQIRTELGLNEPVLPLGLLPLVVLGVAGYAVARSAGGSSSLPDAAMVGASIVTGYLPPAAAGAFLFSAAPGNFSVTIDPLAATLFAGLAYPLVGGTLGGLLYGLASESTDRQPVAGTPTDGPAVSGAHDQGPPTGHARGGGRQPAAGRSEPEQRSSPDGTGPEDAGQVAATGATDGVSPAGECPACGADMADADDFCRRCGAELS